MGSSPTPGASLGCWSVGGSLTADAACAMPCTAVVPRQIEGRSEFGQVLIEEVSIDGKGESRRSVAQDLLTATGGHFVNHPWRRNGVYASGRWEIGPFESWAPNLRAKPEVPQRHSTRRREEQGAGIARDLVEPRLDQSCN